MNSGGPDDTPLNVMKPVQHTAGERLIDARNDRFTRLDGDALQGALLRWLANPDREVAAENLDQEWAPRRTPGLRVVPAGSWYGRR
jgi:hypothetical protein